MHHARMVRRRESVQGLTEDAQGLADAEGALLVHLVSQVHAMHVFHDEIVEPVEFAGVVDLHDVRVRYRGRGLRLTSEPFDELLAFRPLRQLIVHDFDGDGAS